MITLKILFSKEEEVQRVISTLRDWDWFEKNKYNPLLPANIDKNVLCKDEESTISLAVDSEFIHENYEKSKIYIEDHSDEILPNLNKFIETIGCVPQNEYAILLTMYGTGGSYHPPNKIIINIKMKYEKGLMRTITHEILHLSIHDLIQKHNISHWQKEHIIDLLLSKCLPDYAKFQNVPIEIKMIDQAFEQNFPDLDKILTDIK